MVKQPLQLDEKAVDALNEEKKWVITDKKLKKL